MKKILTAAVALPLLFSGAAHADRWGGDRHHFRSDSGYHHYRPYGGSYRHHRYHGPYYNDAGAALAAGLLVGGLIGYSLDNDSYAATTYVYPYPQATTVYRTIPAPAPATVVVQQPVAAPECLMTREYTATITVDGRPKQAYGTKCMKADGSWVYGAMNLTPDFP
jgi:surface antigen